MKNINSTKTEEKREKQRQRLIEVAETMVASDGIAHLRARSLAAQAGIALGQIYNLFGDLDEIILAVNSRTIATIEDMLAQQIADISPASVEENLVSVAIHYHHFARDHYHLWHALFDHHPQRRHKTLPDWVRDEHLRPFLLIEKLLTPLCSHMSQQEIRIFAQTLFSSVHGIILLALDARDVGVPKEQLDEQLRLYLSLLCRGLGV